MMNYKDFKKDDFVRDEYFQRWVLEPDSETQEFWTNWLDRHPEREEALEEARRTVELLAEGMEVEKLSREDFFSMWENITERKEKSGQRTVIWKRVVRVAAVFVGIIILGYGIFQTDFLRKETEPPAEISSGLTLELQDGTIVSLDESASGVISTVGGKEVVTQDYQKLVYTSDMSGETEELEYNTLTVPYGKKFELVLSDGTHIYLNSGSRLRYPIRFLKDTPRDVFLDGEGYFSVVRDEIRPFTVRTGEMDTRVFGTEFNVSSYENDHNTFTVLVEGSVGVSRSGEAGESDPITLVPGQRATFENGAGAINVEEANIDKYTAWLEGKLLFTDDPFDLVLKKLERHFDVEIDNQFGEINKRRFTGTFRDESLDQILKVFRAHTPFEYVSEGKLITIKK